MRNLAITLLLALGAMVSGALEPTEEYAGWRADSLVLADLRPPSSGEECIDRVRGPFRLPPRPTYPALGLLFADGRQARWDSLLTIGGTHYWPLERACAALGATLAWDPTFFRGELTVDSLTCGFVVGGEVIHFGGQAIQLPAPVLYVGERLLLPLGFVPHAAHLLMADRTSFLADSLILAQRPGAGLEVGPSTRQVGRRTYITWMLPERGRAFLTADGAYGLIVDVPGAEVDPLNPPAFEPRPAACLRAVRPYRGGVEYILSVAATTTAWRVQWPEDSTTLRVTLSSNRGDLAYRTYHPWEAPPALDSPSDSARVILVVPRPWVGESAFAFGTDPRCLATDLVRQIGYRLREVLEQEGRQVIVLEDAGNHDWTAPANSHGGDLCVCLQPDYSGETLFPGWRIVTPAMRPGERGGHWLRGGGASPADDPAAELPPLRSWEAVDAVYLNRGQDLAWLMRLYLETEFPELRITAPQWPALPFEGLAMPAAIVYIGEFGDAAALAMDETTLLVRRAAGALAGSVRTYFRMVTDG